MADPVSRGSKVRRWLQRMSGRSAPATADLTEAISEMNAAAAFPRPLPSMTFRCAECGIKVGSADKDRFCPQHGELTNPSLAELYEVWDRRGRPPAFTYKLEPVQ